MKLSKSFGWLVGVTDKESDGRALENRGKDRTTTERWRAQKSCTLWWKAVLYDEIKKFAAISKTFVDAASKDLGTARLQLRIREVNHNVGNSSKIKDSKEFKTNVENFASKINIKSDNKLTHKINIIVRLIIRLFKIWIKK